MHLDLNVLCIPSRHIAMPYGICLDFILGFVLDDIGSCPSWKLQGARHRHLGYCPKAHTYLCLSSSCPYHHAQIPVDTPPRNCDISPGMIHHSIMHTPLYHAYTTVSWPQIPLPSCNAMAVPSYTCVLSTAILSDIRNYICLRLYMYTHAYMYVITQFTRKQIKTEREGKREKRRGRERGVAGGGGH